MLLDLTVKCKFSHLVCGNVLGNMLGLTLSKLNCEWIHGCDQMFPPLWCFARPLTATSVVFYGLSAFTLVCSRIKGRFSTLGSGVWLSHGGMIQLFAFRNSWVSFHSLLWLLSVRTLKHCPLHFATFAWIWADSTSFCMSEFGWLLPSSVTSSINGNDSVSLEAVHAHAITLPPCVQQMNLSASRHPGHGKPQRLESKKNWTSFSWFLEIFHLPPKKAWGNVLKNQEKDVQLSVIQDFGSYASNHELFQVFSILFFFPSGIMFSVVSCCFVLKQSWPKSNQPSLLLKLMNGLHLVVIPQNVLCLPPWTDGCWKGAALLWSSTTAAFHGRFRPCFVAELTIVLFFLFFFSLFI